MKPLYWLGFVPVIMNLLIVIFGSSATPLIFGIPTFWALTVGGVFVTSALMLLIFKLDPINKIDQ